MSNVTKLEFGRTARGFDIANFRDANGAPCSLQHSSAVGDYDDSMDAPGSSFLWLGVDDAAPKVMASQAAALGVKTEETTGWVPYPIPEDVSLTTRMHLDREQVAALIAAMQAWLDTGSISGERR